MLVNITNKTRYITLHRQHRARICMTSDIILVDKEAHSAGYWSPLLRNWDTYANAWGYGQRRSHFAQTYGKQLLPLVYNHRKRDELMLTKGAVVTGSRDRTLYVLVGRKLLARWNGDADDDFVHISELREPTYHGHLPTKQLIDRFIEQRSLFMEDIQDQYFETEYIRGPRVEVIHHTLDLADIDPANDDFDRLRKVALPLIMEIQNTHSIDIRQLSRDNDRHVMALRLLLAAYKHGLFDLPKIGALQNLDCYRLTTARDWQHNDKRPLFIHPNPDDPRLVRFYNGYKDLIRGRVSTAKPGKLVGRMLEGRDEESIKVTTNRVQMEILPSTFELITDPERIRDAYLKGPSSCASKPWTSYSVLNNSEARDLHPTMVYGSTDNNPSDTMLAVCWKGDMPVCRAVVSRHSMQYPRIYFMDDCETARNEFINWLDEQGYSLNSDALTGSVLRHVTFDGHLLMPYIDMNNKPVHYCMERELCIVGGPGWIDRLSPLARELLARGGQPQLNWMQPVYSSGAIPREHLYANTMQLTLCPLSGEPVTPENGAAVIMPDLSRARVHRTHAADQITATSMLVSVEHEITECYIHNDLLDRYENAPALSQRASMDRLDVYGPVKWLGDSSAITAGLIEHQGQHYLPTELVQIEGAFYLPEQIVCWTAPDGTKHFAVGTHTALSSAVQLQAFIDRAQQPNTTKDADDVYSLAS